MKFTIRLFAIIFIVCLSACGSSNNQPVQQQHLYVGNDNTASHILQYTLPITGASTPVATIAADNITCLALDAAGNLAAGDNAGHLSIFSAPLTSASTASATFKNGSATNDGQLLFNGVGDLFATTDTTAVNLFTPPLSSASTVSQTITDASITSAVGAVLDASGNLIVSNGNNLAVFAPPFTAAPTVTPTVTGAFYRKIAISNNQLFVARVDGAGGIDVYNLPLTSASAPLFTMTNVNIPEAVAFDNSGNLYVGNDGDATIRVFSPPFAATSTPSVTLTVGTPSSFAIFGIAIGK
jgi:hypothetical protein